MKSQRNGCEYVSSYSYWSNSRHYIPSTFRVLGAWSFLLILKFPGIDVSPGWNAGVLSKLSSTAWATVGPRGFFAADFDAGVCTLIVGVANENWLCWLEIALVSSRKTTNRMDEFSFVSTLGKICEYCLAIDFWSPRTHPFTAFRRRGSIHNLTEGL